MCAAAFTGPPDTTPECIWVRPIVNNLQAEEHTKTVQELERRLAAMPQGKENLVGEGTDSDEAALLRKLNGRLLGEIATYKRQLGAMERQGVSPEQC